MNHTIDCDICGASIPETQIHADFHGNTVCRGCFVKSKLNLCQEVFELMDKFGIGLEQLKAYDIIMWAKDRLNNPELNEDLSNLSDSIQAELDDFNGVVHDYSKDVAAAVFELEKEL